MSSGVSLDLLKLRKDTVNEGIANTKERIADAQAKIERLQEASSAMETNLEGLSSVKKDIDNFEVTKSKWKGVEEKNFEAKHNSYGIYVSKYDSDASKAKEQIDKDLENAKTEKSNAEIGLANLESLLIGLESDIQLAKEAK